MTTHSMFVLTILIHWAGTSHAYTVQMPSMDPISGITALSTARALRGARLDRNGFTKLVSPDVSSNPVRLEARLNRNEYIPVERLRRFGEPGSFTTYDTPMGYVTGDYSTHSDCQPNSVSFEPNGSCEPTDSATSYGPNGSPEIILPDGTYGSVGLQGEAEGPVLLRGSSTTKIDVVNGGRYILPDI